MIYKTAHGELWCDCGNTMDTQGFLPVDAKGNSLAYNRITGAETRFRRLHPPYTATISTAAALANPAVVHGPAGIS